MPEAESGNNMARVVALRAGLPDTVTGLTINRFCSSGLQSIALAADRIRSGGADIILAGGSESMSLIPMGGNKLAPNPWLVDHRPEVYMNMGLTAEQLQRRYHISRDEQDAFALRSHRNALRAQAEGSFADEIAPVGEFRKDEGPRADTTAEALAKLKPVFHAQGTVTAGNSSQMSDGAAIAIVMSDGKARSLGLKPMARFAGFAVGGVAPEVMGIGPVVAIPKALALAGLKLADIDVIELNEAFAVQALAVIREARLDVERVNVNGGAIALGHPLGCTGAKLTATILREMPRRNAKYGMVTMCVGGGQGAAGDLRENMIQTKGGAFLIEERTPQEIFTPEDLTEEHRAIARAADEFWNKEVAPRLDAIDHGDHDAAVAVLKKSAELGLTAILTPEIYGGMELDLTSAMVAAEHLARDGSYSAWHGAHSGIGTTPLLLFGTEAQKQKYLPRLSSAEMVAAYCLSEPTSGSDALNVKTRADLSPDGANYILNGQKMWITNGGGADLYTIFAKVGGEKFTAFLVERKFPGVQPGAEEKRWGSRAARPRPFISTTYTCPWRTCWGRSDAGILSRSIS